MLASRPSSTLPAATLPKCQPASTGGGNIDDKLLQSVHHRPGWSILRGACRHGASDWSGARETAQNGGQGLISCSSMDRPWTARAGENRQTGTRHDPGGSISNRRATGPGAQLNEGAVAATTPDSSSRTTQACKRAWDEGAEREKQPWPAAGARHVQVPGHEAMSAVCAGGPHCAVPVLVRPRPARSRLVGRLSVCHFSASGYRRRRGGALLDPVCLFERLMRLTDASGAFALPPDDGVLEATSHLFSFLAQWAILGLAPRSGEFYTGHDGDGQSRADATATAAPAPRIYPRFPSAILIPCRAVSPNPLEAAFIININKGLAGSTRAST